jgi:hypothetical protein
MPRHPPARRIYGPRALVAARAARPNKPVPSLKRYVAALFQAAASAPPAVSGARPTWRKGPRAQAPWRAPKANTERTPLPSHLAIMHGSSLIGNSAAAPNAVADDYDTRLVAASESASSVPAVRNKVLPP